MPIEAPIRELGIHDVFQLLDLSRKTGVLRVTSAFRDDEGTVAFDGGSVVHASIRSVPGAVEHAMLSAGRITRDDLQRAEELQTERPERSIGDILIDMGAASQRELERYQRQQIETVVFELMSWSEGYFSFEESQRDELPAGFRIKVSTESLLMEAARRIDEWSRIADTIPHSGVIPGFASLGDDREGPKLDLLPHEWHVLTLIDGARDIRGIAAAIDSEEFEIAKVVYGLVRTGVVAVRDPVKRPTGRRGRSVESLTSLATARAHSCAGRYAAAVAELRRAVEQDALVPDVHRALGFAAVRAGELELAQTSWEAYLRLAAGDAEAAPVREALDHLRALNAVLEADDRN